MRSGRQAATIAVACFRPRSLGALSGIVAWGAYLAWVATGIVDRLGTTAYIHLLFAVATLGAWLGACAGRARRWPNAILVPGYRRATNFATAAAAAAGFGCSAVAAWFGGLALWPPGTVGALALATSALVGLLAPGSAAYLLIGMWAVAILGPSWGPDVIAAVGGWAVLTLPCAIAVAWAFAALPIAPGRPGARHASGLLRRLGLLRAGGVYEPSLVRVAGVFGGLAIVAPILHLMFGTDLKDESWLVLLGIVCANTGVTGASVALPRGPLAGASWLLLLGAAGRGGVGRRVQRRILGDSLAALVVFAAVTAVFGTDFRLVVMLLLGFACSNAYMAVAAGIHWLMSSRFSGLAATPVVVAMVLAVWETGSWGLLTAATAWIATGCVAVLAGGAGIGRLDLDAGLTVER